MAHASLLVASAVDALGHADGAHVRPLVRELRGVLDQQDRAVGRIATSACGGEVAAENVALVNTRIGKKPVGRLGVCPVLAGVGNAFAHGVADQLQ